MNERAAPSDRALASAPDTALKRDRLHRPRRRPGVLRPRLRRDGRGRGRALLQHGDDRLPGDHDRSLLRRADRHLHLPAHRQRRGEPRRRRDRRPGRRRHGGEVGPDRAVELARRRDPVDLADPPRPHRRRWRRHPPPDPRDPSAGRAARRDLPRPGRRVRSRRPRRARPRLPRASSACDFARDVTCAQSYRWDEMRWAWAEGYTRRIGPGRRVVAIDYGAKRNILRCLASAGCA